MLGGVGGAPVTDQAEDDEEWSELQLRVDPEDGPWLAHSLTHVIAQASVVIAATTFLQTVTQHFGNRLLGTIDDGTRAAVRRFLRRQNLQAGSLAAEIELRTERGWRVSFTPDVPAEALQQLSDLCNADPPHPELGSFLINYGRGGWEGWGGVDGEFTHYRWEPEGQCWTPRQPIPGAGP